MNSYDLRNLQEAYMEVYENQQLDEGYKDLPKKRMTMAGLKHAGRAAVLGAISTAAMAADDGDNTVSFDNSTTELMHKGQTSGKRALKIAKTRLTHSPQKAQAKSAENKARGTQKEQVDLYDLILSHLLDEGYAETPEAAEVMMVNMSEEWRESIMEENMKKSPRNIEKTKQKAKERKDRRVRIKYYSKDAVGHGTGEQLRPSGNH